MFGRDVGFVWRERILALVSSLAVLVAIDVIAVLVRTRALPPL
jgi:hypothetical protein